MLKWETEKALTVNAFDYIQKKMAPVIKLKAKLLSLKIKKKPKKYRGFEVCICGIILPASEWAAIFGFKDGNDLCYRLTKMDLPFQAILN